MKSTEDTSATAVGGSALSEGLGAGAEMRALWNLHVLPHFPAAGCACPGTCRDMGFCPLTGALVALTPAQAEGIAAQDKEIADALHWWRAIKAKRAQAVEPAPNVRAKADAVGGRLP